MSDYDRQAVDYVNYLGDVPIGAFRNNKNLGGGSVNGVGSLYYTFLLTSLSLIIRDMASSAESLNQILFMLY